MLRSAQRFLVRLMFASSFVATASALQAQTEPAAAQGTQPASDLWQRDTLTGDWDGLRDLLKAAGIQLGLQEQDELWGNLEGGLRRGATYDGLTTGSVKLDLQRLLGWDGATVFADAYQIHGRGPTATLVGNLQTVSSIEATPGTKLYDLWLEQDLWDGRLNVRIGQAGAEELMLADLGALFLNSSFGNPALTALDLPSGGPNYPLATPMVRIRLKATPQLTVVGAVFNGDPAPPGPGNPQQRDASGTAFRLNDHALSFLELWYSTEDKEMPGTYKLGAWYDSGRFADLQTDTTGRSLADPASNGVPLQHRGDYAIYAIANQMIWRPSGADQEGLGVFGLVMTAPADRNPSDLYVAAGLNWTGPLPNRKSDAAGVAVAYAHISRSEQLLAMDRVAFSGTGTGVRNNETIVEATYQCQVAPWWTLQPDAQFVINPGAGLANPTNANQPLVLKNAWIIGVRGTIIF
jgi:porin